VNFFPTQEDSTMLVLSRKAGERVMIGNNIAVKVVEVRGNRVKLGFECPEGIPVNREEIHRRFSIPDLVSVPDGGTDELAYDVEFA